jgi:hypothetical protein
LHARNRPALIDYAIPFAPGYAFSFLHRRSKVARTLGQRDLLMRSNLIALAAIAGSALSACSVPPFKGNDTGGIIAWSPETHKLRHQLAAQHCADYDGKTYQITSVRARYGDYIAFRCYWPRGTGPVGADPMIVRRAY